MQVEKRFEVTAKNSMRQPGIDLVRKIGERGGILTTSGDPEEKHEQFDFTFDHSTLNLKEKGRLRVEYSADQMLISVANSARLPDQIVKAVVDSVKAMRDDATILIHTDRPVKR